MSEYLFTYGTLQPGMAPDEVAAAVNTLRRIGEGFVRGTLYDLGDFPGAVLDPLSKHKISGTVFQLSNDADVLRQLDDYEEYDPSSPDKSLFLRTLQSVQLATGSTLTCWVYVYNQEPKASRVVANGKFTNRHRVAS